MPYTRQRETYLRNWPARLETTWYRQWQLGASAICWLLEDLDWEELVGKYRAEYIWMDGTQPTPLMRSKTKVLKQSEEPPLWGFDGSSTNQASGSQSDCVLQPVFSVEDPIRGGKDRLVLCEVLDTELKPHPSNTRAPLRATVERYQRHEPLFGLEQEYTFLKPDGRPLGFPSGGYPGPQGPYYCGVGGSQIYGRDIVERHFTDCLKVGLEISGINAEVMPGQWEFQVGPLEPTEVSDHLLIARWLLCRIAEHYDCDATFDPKPAKGDWNGAGCHTNFSTNEMREGWEPIMKACKALEANADAHVRGYGHGIEDRLTGHHETQRWDKFSYGVSDRSASVRIPWQVSRDRKGYLEDRRPNANCDPYTVTRLMVETVCSALEGSS